MTASSPDRTGHVILCGAHGVGLRTLEQLYLAGVPVAVVEPKPDARLIRQLAEWDVPLFTGSAEVPETLTEAGIERAAAVVCLQDGDLHTLATALLVREMRPDIRTVVRLSNQAVGGAVAELTGVGSVLDVAELAAPAVVEDCLRSSTHSLELAGRPFVVASTEAPRGGTLRELYGDLAPIAVVPHDGELVVCPGRDEVVVTGERVTLLGTAEQLAAVGVDVPPDAVRLDTRRGRIRHVYRLAETFLRELDRPLWYVLGALALLIVVASVVLRINYHLDGGKHLSWNQSIYFAIETVATVGYGDFSFATQSGPLRTFGVVLIVLGVLFVSTTFALLTNALVSRRLEASLGRQQATSMRNHVVLIGLGSFGVRVLEGLLEQGKEVVVLERDENNRYLAQARALGVPVITADATLRPTLQAVNVPLASAVAVLTSDDLTNIETGLAVREALGDRWMSVPVVLRVFDRQLARTVERGFGFRHVRSASVLASPWFVGAALGLDVLAPVRPHPRRRDRPGERRRGIPTAARHPIRGRRSGVPHRPVRGAADRAASRPERAHRSLGWPACPLW
jgi:voltage-gated potassium channel Kch